MTALHRRPRHRPASRGRVRRAPSRSRRGVGDRFRGPEARRARRRRRTRARRPAPGPRAVPRRRAPEARSRPAAARAGSTFRSPTKASSGPRRPSAPPARNPSPTAPGARPGATRRRVGRFRSSSKRRSGRAPGAWSRRTSTPGPWNRRIHTCPRWDGRAARRGAARAAPGLPQSASCRFGEISLFSGRARRDSRLAGRARCPGDAHKYAAFAGTAHASGDAAHRALGQLKELLRQLDSRRVGCSSPSRALEVAVSSASPSRSDRSDRFSQHRVVQRVVWPRRVASSPQDRNCSCPAPAAATASRALPAPRPRRILSARSQLLASSAPTFLKA